MQHNYGAKYRPIPIMRKRTFFSQPIFLQPKKTTKFSGNGELKLETISYDKYIFKFLPSPIEFRYRVSRIRRNKTATCQGIY